MNRLVTLATAALFAGGCTTTMNLTLMPRDSGKLYAGTADGGGGEEGRITITIDGKVYAGTWVQTVPSRSTGTVTGGMGWGGRYGYGGWGIGSVNVDNPHGGEAKALLSAPDGSGLRCELRGGPSWGGGVCRDDRGREYDVQVRPAATSP